MATHLAARAASKLVVGGGVRYGVFLARPDTYDRVNDINIFHLE